MNKRGFIPALALALLLSACAPAAGVPAANPESTPSPSPDGNRGLLAPYIGQRVFDQWGYGEYYMRGLMTLDGEAVTQPVYTGAEPMYYYEERGTSAYAAWRYLPVYLLTQGVPDGGGAFTTERLGVSALDGSWCTDLIYTHYAAGEDGFREGLAPWPDGESYGYVDKDGAWAIPPQYSGAQPFYGGRALVRPTWDTFALIDKTGAPLLSGEGYL